MPLAVHLPVFLEDAVSGAGAHEVVVSLAGRQAAAYRGTRLVALLTALGRGEQGADRGITKPNAKVEFTFSIQHLIDIFSILTLEDVQVKR